MVWTQLKDQDLIDPLLLRSAEAAEKATSIVNVQRQKQLDLESRPSNDSQKDKTTFRGAKDFNLAVWYIKQVGDIDRAERMFNLAINALRDQIG
jgi:hypothetical protein